MWWKLKTILLALTLFSIASSFQKDSDYYQYAFQAAVYADKKDYQNAIDRYTKAINLLPQGDSNHLYFLNERGLVYLRAFEIENAIKDFNKVIEILMQKRMNKPTHFSIERKHF